MTATEPVALPSSVNTRGARRLLVSLSLVVATTSLGSIPSPGADVSEVLRFLEKGHWWDITNFSIGAAGIGPILWGFLIVEFAALVVPRWRHLRLPEGRATLRRAAGKVAVVMAAFQ